MPSELILDVLNEHGHLAGAMLPVLHAIQERVGHVPDEAIPLVARHLNVSQAEVHGVLSFYHDFRRTPPPRHVVRLCQAEACQARGSEGVAARARERLGCDFLETSTDGLIALEPVYCLGLCAVGPSAIIDGTLHARLTPARLETLLSPLTQSASAIGGEA